MNCSQQAKKHYAMLTVTCITRGVGHILNDNREHIKKQQSLQNFATTLLTESR